MRVYYIITSLLHLLKEPLQMKELLQIQTLLQML